VTFALGGTQRTQFTIAESFRGPERGLIEVLSEGLGGSCDYSFRHGAEYLVFARRAPGGPWKVSICSGTAPIADAQEDLAFAKRATSGPVRGGRVYGSVYIADVDSDRREIASSAFSHGPSFLKARSAARSTPTYRGTTASMTSRQDGTR
jgi:hypothetical protein